MRRGAGPAQPLSPPPRRSIAIRCASARDRPGAPRRLARGASVRRRGGAEARRETAPARPVGGDCGLVPGSIRAGPASLAAGWACEGPGMTVSEDFTSVTGQFRGELLAHCYRMLGSAEEAEDLAQEPYLRAWRPFDGFEGPSSMRTWLYRIAA